MTRLLLLLFDSTNPDSTTSSNCSHPSETVMIQVRQMILQLQLLRLQSDLQLLYSSVPLL